MQKKVFISLIILALLAAGFAGYNRHLTEKSSDQVALVYDYQGLSRLQEKETSFTLSRLKKEGVTGIALFEDTIGTLLNDGQIKLITGNELERRQLLSGVHPAFAEFEFDSESAFMIITESSLIERANQYIDNWRDVTDKQGIKSSRLALTEKEGLVVFFPKWENNFLDLSLGFDPELMANIKEAGLKVIPRLEARDENNSQFLTRLPAVDSPFIIFAGSKIPGYPDQLDLTSQALFERDLKLGMIEAFIGYQEGVNSLAKRLNYNLLRVHSIQQGEMEKYSLQRVKDRYRRAVRERNVRVLYLKPFLSPKNGQGVEALNYQFLSGLKEGLNQDGFEVGSPQPLPIFYNSFLSLLLIALGAGVAGIWLLERLIGQKIGLWSWLLLTGMVLIVGALFYLNQVMLLRKLLALGISIVFPSLAVIHGFLEKNRKGWLKRLARTAAISLAGALLLSGSLNHLSFVLKIDQFRGVKLSFLVPLIFIAWYSWREYYYEGGGRDFWAAVHDFLEAQIRVKHLLLLSVVGMVGLVYILRTGNYSFLPLPDIERFLREFLEDVLYVRPRFKAFLFGHPFLVLGLYLRDSGEGDWFYMPLALLAGVGQITVLNTFAHLHIPFKISIIRSLHGYWLGIIGGLVLIGLWQICVRIVKKVRKSRNE